MQKAYGARALKKNLIVGQSGFLRQSLPRDLVGIPEATNSAFTPGFSKATKLPIVFT